MYDFYIPQSTPLVLLIYTLLHSVPCVGIDAILVEELTNMKNQWLVARPIHFCIHVTVHIIPGGYDEHLCWSFRGEVKITLLSRYECM